MTVLRLAVPAPNELHLARRIGFWDSDTECTVYVTQPTVDPDLWAEYLDGASRSYHKHGVERALELDQIQDGEETILFFAAVDTDGRVVGGVRAKGPLRSADDSHAAVEWAGQPGLHAARKMITDRLPFGVVEMKTAWVTDDPGRYRSLTKTLARTPFPTMNLLDSQFVLATAGKHVLDRWRSSGGVVAPGVPATPYPDERYQTKMMWWDRRTFANHAEPEQVSKIFFEMMALAERSPGLIEVGAQRESRP